MTQPDVLMVLLVTLLGELGKLPYNHSKVMLLMLLGVQCKLVELPSKLRELLLTLVDLLLDLNKDTTSEPLVWMLQVTSIKKLLWSKLYHQIMVVKLPFLPIPLVKVTSKLVMKVLTLWFSIWPVLYLKDLLCQFIELLMTSVDIVVSNPQLFQLPVEEEEFLKVKLLVTILTLLVTILTVLLNQPHPLLTLTSNQTQEPPLV